MEVDNAWTEPVFPILVANTRRDMAHLFSGDTIIWLVADFRWIEN
jgi:hypothetical protein